MPTRSQVTRSCTKPDLYQIQVPQRQELEAWDQQAAFFRQFKKDFKVERKRINRFDLGIFYPSRRGSIHIDGD